MVLSELHTSSMTQLCMPKKLLGERFMVLILPVCTHFFDFWLKLSHKDIAQRLGSNWKVVARETLIAGAGSMYDEDPVMIVQDRQGKKQ